MPYTAQLHSAAGLLLVGPFSTIEAARIYAPRAAIIELLPPDTPADTLTAATLAQLAQIIDTEPHTKNPAIVLDEPRTRRLRSTQAHTAPNTHKEKTPVNTYQQRAAHIADQLADLAAEVEQKPQHVADLFEIIAAPLEQNTRHELRNSDALAVTYHGIYTESRLNDPNRADLVLAIVAHRNNETSTGTISFRITPDHDTRQVWPHMSYCPSFWAAGKFAPLPDGAQRLIVEHASKRILALVERYATELVHAAHTERARYEISRIIGKAARDLGDVERGIER